MTTTDEDGQGIRVQLRLGGKERAIVVPEAWLAKGRRLARTVAHEPFRPQPWRELCYFAASGWLTAVAADFIVVTLVAGVGLFITFVGVIVMAASVRGARGFGRYHRALARRLAIADIEEPEPFTPKPGFFGWLQSALRDRAG